jgi:protein disulfide-isomerase
MNYIKTLSVTFILVLTGIGRVYAQEQRDGLTWYNDLEKVWEVHVKTKKPIFAFFTGSDWCGWCLRLQANVFSKPGFKAWAAKNVILLELDFPHGKRLPEKLAQQNNDLQQAFKVQGFPTVWIFNMDKDKASGKFNLAALGTLGYPQSAPGKEETTFLENANKVLANKPN